MITAKRAYLIISVFFPIGAFYIVLWLYNLWFDTWDRIKYEPAYSPELDQNKTLESTIFWLVILLAILMEIIFIKKYKQFGVKE
jgi:hypothetical protein